MERIYRENWKNYSPFDYIIGVETENGNKYILQPNSNCDGFVSVNLKIFTDSYYLNTTDLDSGLDQAFNEIGKRVYRFDSMQEMVAWATS